MKVVQPIRDLEKLTDIMDYLKGTSERNYIMFMVGIFTGLRISDILQLKVKDVKDKEYMYIKEEKRDKVNRLYIMPDLKKALKIYVSGKEDNEYLIKSRKGENKPIRRQTAYQILSEAARYNGLKEIGTHTMRKTMGYHFYRDTKDIAALMKILNHNDSSYTLRYIGIDQDRKDDAMKGWRYNIPRK